MSSRKGDIMASGESQKQTLTAAKVKQKKISNASDSLPGPINLTKKPVKKTAATQKISKVEQKNAKTAKTIKKIEKDIEDVDEKKDLVKKSPKQKLIKDKIVTKPVKKLIKEILKKEKNSISGSTEKTEKLPPKLQKSLLKKLGEKEEKKPKEKIQKEKKVKEIKKKSPAKAVKKGIEKNIGDIESTKTRVDVKTDKKDKPKKNKVTAKNKLKLNSTKKIEDNPPIECMDIKQENQDDVALLQVFQLKNGPVCEFDANVCNTITIRQDNTCIKIKEISVSQLPYSVKPAEEKMDVKSTPLKKESKQITADIHNTEKLVADKHKPEKQKSEKPKVAKQKAEKPKNAKQITKKPKTDKQKTVKIKNEKQKVEKQKTIEEKPVKKSAKTEKTKKPVLIVDKIKPKGKTKITPKANKVKGRPAVSKRPRVASLNAIAKVHCLYENESKSALIDEMAASTVSAAVAPAVTKGVKNKHESDAEPPARKGKRTSKRTTPGLKSVGRHWDMHDTSSTNSSSSGIDDVKYEPPKSAKRTKKQPIVTEPASTDDDDDDDDDNEEEEEVVTSPKESSSPTGGSSKRKRRSADNVTMALKDMVVKKRMASLNASAILAASYSTEKKLPLRGAGPENSPKKSSTSCSEASSERSEPDDDAEDEDSDGHRESSVRPAAAAVHPTPLPPIVPPPSSQLAVIVNQDTDVTITTGVYVNSTTRCSTMHEEFCTISGLQYRISSTSHTQTEAVATETLLHADHSVSQQQPPPPPQPSSSSVQQPAAPRPSYAPLTALSSMKPPGSHQGPAAEHHPGPPHHRRHPHPHPHPQPHPHHHHHQYNSAFSAPPQQANGGVFSSDASDNNGGGKHHEQLLQPAPLPPPAPPPYAHGYYQPAGPLITHHHHHLQVPSHHAVHHLHHPPPPHVKPPPAVPLQQQHAPPLVPTPPSSAGTTAGPPPPPPPPTAESSDTEVAVRSTSAPSPPPGYSRYPQGSYHPPPPPSSYYPSPPASASLLQYPPSAGPHPVQPGHYLQEPPNPCGAYPGPHHQPGYFHHSRSSPYHHHNIPPFHHHRRPPAAPPYVPAGAPPPPPTYYHEYYGPPAPTGSPAHQQQQQMLVAARPGDRPDHHQLQHPQHPQHHPPPDAYPAPQPLYYSPYGAPPGPSSCYSAAPPPRTYVDPAYHSCPCPMQSCPNPKNVHTGPLTGAVSKGPKHHSTVVTTLPPVALALPQEPPRAHGPPSPTRGSAGPPWSSSGCSPSKQQPVPWIMSPLSPARASVQHLTPRSPAMLAAKNPTSEWNDERCDTTGLLAIGKVLSRSVMGLDQSIVDVVPKIEPIDDEPPSHLSSYYDDNCTIRADGERREDADRPDGRLHPQSIDLSTKPRERPEAKATTVRSCNPSPVNNNNNNISIMNNNNNNNNGDGEIIVKGSAKRKKTNPGQIVLPKKFKKIREEDNNNATVVVHAGGEVANDVAAVIATVGETEENEIESTAAATAAAAAMAAAARAEDEGPPPMTVAKRKNSIISIPDLRSEREKLEESLTEEILRSVLTDDSDADGDMIAEAFVKRKGAQTKRTKKGRRDRKNGGNKKEMTDAMKRERMREEFAQLSRLKTQDLAPRWSNGWMWHGEPRKRAVYLENEDAPVLRKCYPSMRHMQGDTIYAKDCVLLKSGSRKNDLPFIAKIANLWEDPVTGEMMMSLLWYYRPEHTKQGRQKEDMPDELFASKHRDVNSVACIDDRCFVLTFNEYCRHRKHAKSVQENLTLCKAVVPPLQEANPRARQLPPVNGSPPPAGLVFFCRRVYDCRQKRLLKKPSL